MSRAGPGGSEVVPGLVEVRERSEVIELEVIENNDDMEGDR